MSPRIKKLVFVLPVWVSFATPQAFASRFPDAWKTFEEEALKSPIQAPDFDPVISDLQNAVERVKGQARPFVPFKTEDLAAIPTEAQQFFQRLPNGKIGVKDAAGKIVQELLPEEWVRLVNEEERELAAIGASVRDAGEIAFQELPTPVKELREQFLNELGVDPKELVDRIRNPIPEKDCPNLNLDALPRGLDKLNVVMPDASELDASSLLQRIDKTQSVLCTIGYSMLDTDLRDAVQNLANLAPNSPELQNVVQNLLNRRKDVLDSLGIPSELRGLNLQKVLQPSSIKDLENTIGALSDLSKMSGPELVKHFRNSEAVQTLTNLEIPHIPEIPLPGKPERTPLIIKKEKSWNGLNMGDRSVLAMEGFAKLIVGGTEVSQTLRADAQANVYVFKKSFNVVDGLGELTIGEGRKNEKGQKEGVRAHLHMKVVGFNVFDPIDEGAEIKFVKEDLEAVTLSGEVGYQQTFMIGPVPVAVRAGGFYKANFGYRIGLINTKLEGMVIPELHMGGFASGGVGVAGFISAGAGAELTVIAFRAPIRGGAQLKFDPEAYPFLEVFINTDVDLHLLDGRVYAYAEFPVPFKIKKKRMDIFKFKGPRYNHKIMSWNIIIGRKGANMGGDIVDQTDRAEAEALEKVIALDNRAEELNKYQGKLITMANRIWDDLQNESRDPKAGELAALPAAMNALRNKLNDNFNKINL